MSEFVESTGQAKHLKPEVTPVGPLFFEIKQNIEQKEDCEIQTSLLLDRDWIDELIDKLKKMKKRKKKS
ncbi:MAG: hypothetical protein K9M56_04375 [Victivallales bacterium]|nr:hypothetical protein [Victivallales bacterium]